MCYRVLRGAQAVGLPQLLAFQGSLSGRTRGKMSLKKASIDDLDRLVLGTAVPVHDALPAKAQDGKRLSGFAERSGFHRTLLLR
jgi:hypothetical protein